MFESTLPFGAPELLRTSDFRRGVEESVRTGETAGRISGLSSLSPSLAQDLMRFESVRPPTDGFDVLEVLAACVRHSSSLLLHLEDGERVVPLTVFPIAGLVHNPVPMEQFLAGRLLDLAVIHVEPALLRPPGHADPALVGELERYTPIGPLLWELALRGGREELLPQIAGSAAYRISPAMELRGLAYGGTLAAAVQRLQKTTTNLREISEWPGFDRARAMRLLNALYLQAGLIVTRTHPAATNEGWFSGSR
ncbi:MAG: hypothetical protein KGL43_11390 [Burkholderiales bacterium]|nr:hypothetical protein [Burkholderiales bacterium]MDE2454186.1 hypothetical protein [Burkholderiales bacterium]